MSNRIASLIHDLWRLDEDINRLQEQLNRMKSKRAMLATVDLPEAMTEAASKTFTTEDGLKCDVAFKIYGSLPSREDPDRRMAAIQYLKEHDGAELIKSNVMISFGKGDIRNANKTMRFLDAQIKKHVIRGEVEPLLKVDSDVHAQSLAAWARARIKENAPLDLGAVGLRGMTIAEVKRAPASR